MTNKAKFVQRVSPSSETEGQIVGPKTTIKTGGKKFDKQKYERKIRAPGDKLFKKKNFSAQSGASNRSAVWNWCVKSLSPGARIFLSYFCSSNFFPPVLIFVFGPTICPWVSEDEGFTCKKEIPAQAVGPQPPHHFSNGPSLRGWRRVKMRKCLITEQVYSRQQQQLR